MRPRPANCFPPKSFRGYSCKRWRTHIFQETPRSGFPEDGFRGRPASRTEGARLCAFADQCSCAIPRCRCIRKKRWNQAELCRHDVKRLLFHFALELPMPHLHACGVVSRFASDSRQTSFAHVASQILRRGICLKPILRKVVTHARAPLQYPPWRVASIQCVK